MSTTYQTGSTLGVLARQEIRNYLRHKLFWFGAAMTALVVVAMFAWDETEFLQRTEGSAIRRSGHERWLRNIAVALGNAPTTPEVLASLAARRDESSEVVREHVAWALARHTS